MRKRLLSATFLCCLLVLSSVGLAFAQEGPNKGVDETVVVPRKRATKPPEPRLAPEAQPTADAQPKEAQPKKEKLNPDESYNIRTDVDLVSIGVVVQDKKGEFLAGLKKENFHIAEDGVPQKIQRIEQAEAPVTVAMLIEFSSLYWQFLYQTMEAAYGFVNALRPDDWVAVIAFDMRPEILQDFTKNKPAAFGALRMMQYPGFSESNLFDALTDSVKRMDNIDGKKAILLISSGVDTFSKTRYDEALKKLQASDTPVYAIGTGQAMREMADARGAMDGSTGIGFLQADNQLRTFARLSGGKAYFPRFEGQFGEIYNDISASLRNEYNISYGSTNPAHDGKFRKVKVELLDADNKPLKIMDPKGKEIKYEIRTREGYYAPRAVE